MSFDLSSLGWDDDLATAYVRYHRPSRCPARVSRVDHGVCTALAAGGAVRASLAGTMLTAAARDPALLPCTGDWVVVHTWRDRRITVEAVLPRSTVIVRAAAGREALGQVLAANADAVAVVEPMDPEPHPGRIERLLALAWESGAQPLVVLSKADTAADPRAVADQFAEAAPAVPVYAVSARTGAGLDALCPYVAHGRTLALLGRSGAGKSSLVNALAGTTVMTVQALRADGRGRHTTTYRSLVPVPSGGAVLDTPGVRGVGLTDAAAGLDRAFAEVTALAAGCRFADCAHTVEPDCAVQAAVAAGTLAPRRLASWRRLQQEQAQHTRRRRERPGVVVGGDHRWETKQDKRSSVRP
jgi:ribosome biogenesis GTPase / thiamine phosphate phosphatase